MIPDLNEVNAFAMHLHAIGKHWQGEIFGWSAEYAPESRKKPSGSKMRFTPTDFWIGESGIWFYSLMAQPPLAPAADGGVTGERWRGSGYSCAA